MRRCPIRRRFDNWTTPGRQTTLVKKMGTSERTYITLDDQIHEVQRAPDLLLAIKKSVDEDYRPGRFLLTGSANVLPLPKVADSLAGRMETIQMLPLARAEIAGSSPSFLEGLFEGKPKNQPNAVVGDDLVQLVLLGGFPEALSRESERRCQDWARSYLTSILTRDLRDIADVEKLAELPKFVRLLAEHSGQLVNYSQFGANVSHKTGQRYVGLLEQVSEINHILGKEHFSLEEVRRGQTIILHIAIGPLVIFHRSLCAFDISPATASLTRQCRRRLCISTAACISFRKDSEVLSSRSASISKRESRSSPTPPISPNIFRCNFGESAAFPEITFERWP